MKRIQLRPGLHFYLQGREYVIKQRLREGDLQISEVVTEALSNIKETALIQLLFRGELEFAPIEATEQEEKTRNYQKADFTQIPEALRADAKRKYRYINKVFELDLPKRTQASLRPIIEQVSQEINDPLPPSWLTLYRWLKTYESAGQDIRVLVPRYFARGDYRPKLQLQVKGIIDKAITDIYLSLERPDIADVYEEVLRRIQRENQIRAQMGKDQLEIPHRSTIGVA